MTKRKGYRVFKFRLGIFCLIAVAAFAIWAPNADARSTFFNDRGCVGCHSAAGTTCNGCHHHGPSGLGFATVPAGKTTATPGETITLSFTGGSQSGWIRAILYRDNVEIARSTGTTTGGMGGGAGFPITFTTTAPTPSGASQTYTYAVAWFGNTNDSGSAHSEQRAATTIPITVTANNPVPAVTSLSPSSAAAGGAAFTLTVNGSGFVAGSVVRWNGASRTTTFVSATQLRASIQASDITAAGTASVSVFNGTPGGGASNSLTFTVNAAVAPTITTTSLPAGTVGAAYSQSLAATGGTTPYSWSVSAGTLPAGLSLSAAGALTGTPTAAGTSSFTVRVTGANGASSTRALSVTVNAAAVAGPLSVTPAGGLTSTGSFGGPFSPSSQAFTVTNTGGASLNWTAGKTQSWVTLSSTGGTLAAGATTTVTASINSGASSLAAGSYSDTVSFTNATNGTGNTTRPVSLTVNAAPPPPSVGEVSVNPAAGATDVPVNSVVSGTLTGAGDIVKIFNPQTFTLKGTGPEPPGSGCVDDGVVKGAISYNASNTAGTFTPACPLANGTVYSATIASSPGGLSAPKAWTFTTIASSPDTDGDGVPDNEDDFPGNKGKGSPPSSRGKGKFLVDVTGTTGASLASAAGFAETDASLNQAGMPSGYEFPDGLVGYRVADVAPGSTVTVKVTFPSGVPSGSKIYKAGPSGFQEMANPAIQGATVTLTLTDGGAGDSDGTANGVIVDPVGVAVPISSGSGSVDLSNSSSGGGCTVAPGSATGGAGAMAPLLLLLAGAAVRWLRKRNRRG